MRQGCKKASRRSPLSIRPSSARSTPWWAAQTRRKRISQASRSPSVDLRTGLPRHCVNLLIVGLLLAHTPVAAQYEAAPERHSNFYLSAGLGLLTVGSKAGIAIPAGTTAVLSPYRLLFSASAIDIGLLQGDAKDPRYERLFVPGGTQACLDRETESLVSDLRCSGGTVFEGSAGADLSFIPIENLWFGNQPGNLFTGIGFRAFNPKTAYVTFGLLFNPQTEKAGGFKINIGSDYVFVGILGGVNLQRWF